MNQRDEGTNTFDSVLGELTEKEQEWCRKCIKPVQNNRKSDINKQLERFVGDGSFSPEEFLQLVKTMTEYNHLSWKKNFGGNRYDSVELMKTANRSMNDPITCPMDLRGISDDDILRLFDRFLMKRKMAIPKRTVYSSSKRPGNDGHVQIKHANIGDIYYTYGKRLEENPVFCYMVVVFSNCVLFLPTVASRIYINPVLDEDIVEDAWNSLAYSANVEWIDEECENFDSTGERTVCKFEPLSEEEEKKNICVETFYLDPKLFMIKGHVMNSKHCKIAKVYLKSGGKNIKLYVPDKEGVLCMLKPIRALLVIEKR